MTNLGIVITTAVELKYIKQNTKIEYAFNYNCSATTALLIGNNSKQFKRENLILHRINREREETFRRHGTKMLYM